MEIDFLGIGDTVVDDFIKLKDAHVTCKVNKEDCEICLRFGDKVPFESSTIIYGVGNSANAAVAAARLGFKSAIMTNIGGDEYGNKIIRNFTDEKVDTSYITTHEKAPSNYHYVLWYGDERTILVNHFAYEYNFIAPTTTPKILYLSSLAGAAEYHDSIAEYLEAHPSIYFCFQPGTFQIKLGAARLKRLYARTSMLVVNKEEAQRILGLPDTADDIEPLLKGLNKLGAQTVIVSDDAAGAYALTPGEPSTIHLPMYKGEKAPVDKTGAGDSFTTTTCLYFSSGMPLKDAMLRGMINASSVVADIGAQRGLLTKDALEKIAVKR